MSVGTVIRIIECIVTIYCGVVLAVRPKTNMRWDHPFAKVVFCILIGAGMAVDCVNSLWFKFSAITTILLAIYLFFVLLIFFQVYFWQLLIQNFFYWYLIMLYRFLVVYLCCTLKSVSFLQYIMEEYGESWHWIHIVCMLVTMGISSFIVYRTKTKQFIACYTKKDYVWMLLLLLCEGFINEIFFRADSLNGMKNKNYSIIGGLISWSLVCGISIFFAYRMYLSSRKKEQMSEMSLNLLEDQYLLVQKMFRQKRIQVHDAVHHDVLIMEYLQNGQYEDALQYLEKKLEITRSEGKNIYTGLDIIDLILNYKIKQAEKYKIKVDLDLDVFFCPLTDTEMCILMGNLMDNAIEAARELPEEQRWIKIFMKTPNSIFLLHIKNPYSGKRIKVAGHYMTTKLDQDLHGVGMDSVQRVVSKYKGNLDIEDDGKTFKVMVII